MVQRQYGSKSMLIIHAEQLERAAKIIKEAVGEL